VTKLNADGSALVYSTFLGGSGTDEGYGIAVENGLAYVTGRAGTGFPTTGGAYDTSLNGTRDVFVTKLNPEGSNLVYSTFLGGSGSEDGFAIAVEDGTAYITGMAQAGYPTTAAAYDRTYGGSWDAFVTELNADGSSLVYSTYIGGPNQEQGDGIAVEDGFAYITGWAQAGYPTTAGAYDTTYNGGMFDATVTKLNKDGSGLIYSTYIGGSDYEESHDIAVANGVVYITGVTVNSTTNFPTTPGAYDTSNNGEWDGFVAKLDTDADGDGMPDGWEFTQGLNNMINDASFDNDHDGLVNAQEYLHGTMPCNPDTDGDGFADGMEVAGGSDPLDPTSIPTSSGISPSTMDYVIVVAAGLACLLAAIGILSSSRLSKQLRELRQSIGLAGAKGTGAGYTQATDSKGSVASKDSETDTKKKGKGR